MHCSGVTGFGQAISPGGMLHVAQVSTHVVWPLQSLFFFDMGPVSSHVHTAPVFSSATERPLGRFAQDPGPSLNALRLPEASFAHQLLHTHAEGGGR